MTFSFLLSSYVIYLKSNYASLSGLPPRYKKSTNSVQQLQGRRTATLTQSVWPSDRDCKRLALFCTGPAMLKKHIGR